MAGGKRDRSSSRGRVTPKRGGTPAPPIRQRRSLLPGRIGPFERPDPDAPLGQVGRRPSSPAKLAAYSVMYIACGVIALVVLSGALRFVLGVVFIGVGVLWLRGASTAYLRQQRRGDP